MDKIVGKVPMDLLVKWSGRLASEELGKLVKAIYLYAYNYTVPHFCGLLHEAWDDISRNMILCE